MIIRNEKKEDEAIVENLIRDAFWNVHEPGAAEHYLAHKIRTHSDFVEDLNMVAEIDGKIVGSIMYTIGKLMSEDGMVKNCLTFGPIAVHPDYQRRGVGKALMEFTFDKARTLGYECVVIFGHPSNYVSSGFVSCLKKNVCIGDGHFPTAMLVKALVNDVFDGRRWRYEMSTACDFEMSEAEEYDKQFPYKERKVLPSQEEFYIYSHSSIHA